MADSDVVGLVVRLYSPRGQQLLQDVRNLASTTSETCETMLNSFVHQKHLCMCSVVSTVICFNSLCHTDDLRRRYRGQLQPQCAEEDVFKTATANVAPDEETVKRHLPQLQSVVRCHRM